VPQVLHSYVVAHWAGSRLIVSRKSLDPGIKGDKAVRRIRVACVRAALADNMPLGRGGEMIVLIKRAGFRERLAPVPEEYVG
jgi:hypothetical protein